MSCLRSRVPLVLMGLLATLGSFVAGPAGAEAPGDVIDGATDNVYIAPGREFDAADFAAVIDTARSRGVDMFIAAPDDPEPDASAYALRLRQLGEFDVTLVYGPDGEVRGSVSDDYFDGFARAQKAAAAATDPTQAANAFFGELMEEPPGGLPDIVRDVARWVMILAVVVALASAAEMALRARRRSEPLDAETAA